MVPPELNPKCQAVRVWISAAVDGEATETERAALRAHVAECAACSEWSALAESLVLRVRTAEPARPLQQLVLPPQQQTPRRRRARTRTFAAVGLAVAAVAAGVFAGTLGSGSTHQQWTPPGRVVVAINDAPVPAVTPVIHSGRPQDR
jgi:predicted anti-sigma-YlaC factor YlaD